MRIASRQGRGPPIPSITRHARLRREYPGERFQQERALTGRLHERDRELRVFEGKVQVRERVQRGGQRTTRHTIEPEPNAPLLIRVVRYPYRQETYRGRRRKMFTAGMPQRNASELRELPMRSGREFLGTTVVVGNPIRALDIHPSPLPAPPSIDAWLDAVSPRRDLPAMPEGA